MRKFVLTNHAEYRMLERSIEFTDVKSVVKSPLKTIKGAGDKIEVVGKIEKGKNLRVIYKEIGNKIIIITAYYEN